MTRSEARVYYPKRVGLLHWQVWFAYHDGSADPASGATEWMACSHRFYRWLTAARIANEMWSAFNDGVWVGSGAAMLAARPGAKEE